MASAIGLVGLVGDTPCVPQGIPDGLGLLLGEVRVILAESHDCLENYIIHFHCGGVHHVVWWVQIRYIGGWRGVSRKVEGGVSAIGRPDAIPLVANLIGNGFGGGFVKDCSIFSGLDVEAVASIRIDAFN